MDRPHLRFVEAGPMAPTPSIGAVTAPGRALGQFGQALEGIGQQGLQIAEQIRETDEAGKISTWRANADERASKFSDSLLTRQDPDKWAEDWDSVRNEIGGELDALGLSPKGRERAKLQFDNWASDRSSHFSTQAAVRMASEGKARIGNSWTYYAARGDREGMAAMRSEAEASGAFAPSQIEEMTRESERIAAIADVRRAIDSNPVEAPALIDAMGPALTEEDRYKLKRASDIQIQTFQRKALQDISGKIERKEFATEEDLKRALKEAPYIEPGFHDEVLFNFQQSQPVDQETRFALTDQLNDLHDAFGRGDMSMDDYRAAHDELAQVVYSLGARDGAGALRQRVHALDPAAWNGNNLKEGKVESKRRTIQDLGKIYAANGAYGTVDEEAMPAARAGQAQEIYRRREKNESAMTRWADANPDATDDQLNEQFRKTYLGEFADSIIAPSDGGDVDAIRKWLADPAAAEAPAARGGDGPPGARNDTPDKPVGGNLVEVVKKFEAGGAPGGFYAEAYWDHGQWSIGFGTKSKQGEKITQAEAEARLNKELAMHRDRVVAEAGRVGLSLQEHELDALTSFDFNTGSISQLLAGGTRSKAEIASKMLLYRNASGKPLKGLERRRIAESTLFRRGYAH